MSTPILNRLQNAVLPGASFIIVQNWVYGHRKENGDVSCVGKLVLKKNKALICNFASFYGKNTFSKDDFKMPK